MSTEKLVNRLKSKRFFWLVVGLLSFIVIYLLIVVSSQQLFPFQQQNSQRPIDQDMSLTSAFAPTQIEVTGFANQHRPEEAIPFTDLVVLAEITNIGPARWNTKDGQRPADWSFKESFPEWAIFTPFTFKISTTLIGETPPESVYTFAVAGGQVEDDVIDATEAINLYADVVVGDQMILFLRRSTGNLSNVAPYTYIDALRIDANYATAECQGSRIAQECKVLFELSDILTKIEAAEKDYDSN